MNFIKNNNGIAMVTVLMLTALIAMFTISMVFISTNYLQMMGNVEDKTRALEAAEAVAECALAELNKNPKWGIGGTDPNDNMTISLEGATGSITFTGNEYRSYNNLTSPTCVKRADTGDTVINNGTIPAYSAEIICKGQAGRTVKYVKVIFVRDDVYPYSLNSQGKIIFDGNGNIDIRGYSSSDAHIMPGNFHSNWNGEGNSIEQLNNLDIVNAHGGIASAAGKIALNRDDPNKLRIKENLGKYGLVDFEKMDINNKIMDPDKIMDTSGGSTSKIGSGTFLITPLLYIPDDRAKMLKIMNTTYLEKPLLGAAKRSSDFKSAIHDMVKSKTNGWNTVNVKTTYYVRYTDVEGVTKDIREKNADPAYGPRGWDTIKGTKIAANVSLKITGTSVHNELRTSVDEYGNQHSWYETVTRPESASGSVSREYSPSQLGVSSSTFTLSPYNIIYWATTVEPEYTYSDEAAENEGTYDPNTGDYKENEGAYSTISVDVQPLLASFIKDGLIEGTEDIGLAQMDTDCKVTRFYPSGYDENGIASDFTIGKETVIDGKAMHVIDGKFSLTEDLYIASVDASSADITKDLNSLVCDDYKTARRLDPIEEDTDLRETRKAARTDEDIFRIMGFVYNINNKTYAVDASMDMKGHTIYSNANLILGVNVEGQGAMVSKGKIAFLHKGIESSKITCIAKDDLIIQTTPNSKYNINGYLYSDDDVSLEEFDPEGALAGAVIINSSDRSEPDMHINGSIIGLNCNNSGTDDHGNESIRITNNKNKIFTYNSYGWGLLTDMRGDYFRVRRMSWFELN